MTETDVSFESLAESGGTLLPKASAYPIIKAREGTLTAQPFVGPCPAYEGHFFS